MIETIYKNRKNFIIIGLTGRIGSGCTTSAEFLSKKIEAHKLSKICIDDHSTDEHRKNYIIDNNYIEKKCICVKKLNNKLDIIIY